MTTNRQFVEKAIATKLNYNAPTFSGGPNTMTDMDVFPYPRYFRGSYLSETPIVMDREAGWRPVENKCYSINLPEPDIRNEYPNHCFQTATSTVYPCYPDYLRKYADTEAMAIMINKACIPQYR